MFSKSAGMPESHLMNFAYVVSAHKGIFPIVRSMTAYTVPMIDSGRPINASVLAVLAFLLMVLSEFLLVLLMAIADPKGKAEPELPIKRSPQKV